MKVTLVRLVGAMGARGGSALGGLLLSMLVARFAGAEGLGQFAVFTSLLGALALLSLHGTDILLMRSVAWADGRNTVGQALGLLWHGVSPVLLASCALGLLGSQLLASGWLGNAFPGTVALLPVALPMLTALALVAAYMKGRSRAWLAPLFEIGGVSLIAAFVLIGMAWGRTSVDDMGIIRALVIALSLSGAIAVLMIARDRRLDPGQTADKQLKAELRTGRLDFTLIAVATFLAQAGSFLIAAPYLSETELGLLRAAERLVIVISFAVLVVDPVIAPRIVKLCREGDRPALNRMIVKAMALSGGIATPVFCILLIWPEAALALMGPEFTAATGYMIVMALAHFVIAILGPLSMVLNMTGRERMSMRISIATLGLAVVAIPVLSSAFGASGFVAAYTFIIIARLGLLGVLVVLTDPPAPMTQVP